ncbi:MAG: hypothetical protein WCB70_17560, partial [Xanthobacteraceae bacterium]
AWTPVEQSLRPGFLVIAVWAASRSFFCAAPKPMIQVCSVLRGCDPPRLVAREQLGNRTPAGFILEINIRQLLAGAVLHDKAGIVVFLDSPRRREAAGRHRAYMK